MLESGGGSATSSPVGGGAGRRKPSSRERENNKRRERMRRAFASKIYTGLRLQGNYNLPKHCDNNEVLKALCAEAGWVVENDGTTYKKGCKPPHPMEITRMEISSTNPSPFSSYFSSPITSYQPSPSSSSFPSPTRAQPNPLAIFLNSLPPLRISNSAPVTPPTSSPTRRLTLHQDLNSDNIKQSMSGFNNVTFFAASAPVSPNRARRFTTIPESDTPSTIDSGGRWVNFQAYANSNSNSPIFNLVRPIARRIVNVMPDHKGKGKDLVMKPWEGEMIHEVGIMEDLELTLGSGNNTRI